MSIVTLQGRVHLLVTGLHVEPRGHVASVVHAAPSNVLVQYVAQSLWAVAEFSFWWREVSMGSVLRVRIKVKLRRYEVEVEAVDEISFGCGCACECACAC